MESRPQKNLLLSIVLFISVLFILFLFAAVLQGITWDGSGGSRVSFGGSYSEPAYSNAWCVAAAEEDTIHVVYHESRGSDYDIIYAVTTDEGSNWDTTNISLNDKNSMYPAIAIYEQYIHVAWSDISSHISPLYFDIYYTRYNGSSWETPQRISTGEHNELYPSIALSGNGRYVHIVWEDYARGSTDPDIYHIRNTSYGASGNWSGEYAVSDANGIPEEWPSISTTGGNVDVVWCDTSESGTDYDIRHIRNTSNGANGNWGSATTILSDDYDQTMPSVASTSDYVHVACADKQYSAYNEISYFRSADGGSNWTGGTLISDDDNQISESPNLEADGCWIHVTWNDFENDYPDIYHTYCDNYGCDWGSTIENVSNNNSSGQYRPSMRISCDSNPLDYTHYIRIVWLDYTSNLHEAYWRGGEYTYT